MERKARSAATSVFWEMNLPWEILEGMNDSMNWSTYQECQSKVV
jgi:hypothetical protein